MDISQLDLSRLQFATTTIYHFLFVPLTIGLSFLIAVLHTQWYRSGDPTQRRLTKFFGTLLVINIAIGVVTGIVQEFEFGMNWSQYSRFVGDVFGAPLAMEGLAAFFLESTFLGLWWFGWNVLSRKAHLVTVWCLFAGTALSAAFIMAANSWMQRPVGYGINPETGQAELTSISALFTNPIFIWGYAHVLLASLLAGAMLMLSVSAWQMRKGADKAAFVGPAKLALVVLVPVSILGLFVGSHVGEVMTTYQPMKVAAMEAQWETCAPCSFSVFQVGGGKGDQNPTQIIEIPHLLSLLATGTWNGEVKGLNDLQAEYTQEYGPLESDPPNTGYIPNIFIQYWSMRTMAYLGSLVPLLALWGAWLWRRGRLETSKSFLWVSTWAVVTPLIMTTAGWVLTENGRQPWVVQGLLLTQDGNSPSVSLTEVVLSLTGFVVMYLILGIVWIKLMLRYARAELPEDADADAEPPGPGSPPQAPALTY